MATCFITESQDDTAALFDCLRNNEKSRFVGWKITGGWLVMLRIAH
jgi:hypothetical protein